MRWFLISAVGLAAFAAVVIVTLVRRGEEPGGIDDVYTRLFGPADLGEIDFQTLARRTFPNDALVCPQGACPARIDLAPPVWSISGPALREALRKIAADDGAELVFTSLTALEDRFVARSATFRFPDTIQILVIERGTDQATVAIYGRSQIGRSDFGVNLTRIRTWLTRVSAPQSVP